MTSVKAVYLCDRYKGMCLCDKCDGKRKQYVHVVGMKATCLCDAGRCEGVVYIPGLSSEDTHRAIQQSFTLVNSSNSEGMSLAILEVIQQLIFVFLPLNICIKPGGPRHFCAAEFESCLRCELL